jgi:type IV secretory pathway VirB4 component
MEPDHICIATTADGSPIVLSREDRQRHLYIAGKTGVGKSTLMANLAMGDIRAGEGVASPAGHAHTCRTPLL